MNPLIAWVGAILSRHPDTEHHHFAVIIGCLAAIAVSLFGVAAFVASYTGALISYGESIAGAIVCIIVIAAVLVTVYELETHRRARRPHA